MILRDSHQSGRFDANPAQRLAMLKGIADAATVGLITEGVGLHMLEGWDCRGHETKVVWDTAKWDRIASGVESIPTPDWKRGRSARKSVDVTWALLGNPKTGIALLRGGGHLPAHLFMPSQRAANEAALAGLGPLINELVAENAPEIATFSFDLNRPLQQQKQRQAVREAIAGTGLHLVVPPEGTHGRSKIDAAFTTGDLPTPEMLPRRRGFDHRGFRVSSCVCPSRPNRPRPPKQGAHE